NGGAAGFACHHVLDARLLQEVGDEADVGALPYPLDTLDGDEAGVICRVCFMHVNRLSVLVEQVLPDSSIVLFKRGGELMAAIAAGDEVYVNRDIGMQAGM